MPYLSLLLFLSAGLIGITLIDTVGAIASRKMNFRYLYLSVLSFLVYTIIGYLVSKYYGLTAAFWANAILGLYDGTIGLWLSLVLKANNGVNDEEANKMLGAKSAMIMVIATIPFTLIGYGISTI